MLFLRRVIKNRVHLANFQAESAEYISFASESTSTQLTTSSTTIKANLNASTTADNDKDDNKTVVKRSVPVEKNGLTFWNELYDDEYGVQVSEQSFSIDSTKECE